MRQLSVASDMIAIPAYFDGALKAAKGTLAHKAMKVAKAAIGGAAKATGQSGN